jgi:PAS domain S-box-containing protein
MFSLLQRWSSRGTPPAAGTRDDRLRAAFAAAPVGLGVAGFDGRWLLFNDAAATLLGYSREELGRLSLHDITHAEDLPRELDFLRRMAAGEVQRYQIEKRVIDKRGNEREVIVTAAIVRGRSGGADTIVYVIGKPQPPTESGRTADGLSSTILELREELQRERESGETLTRIVEKLKGRLQDEASRAAELEVEVQELRERLAGIDSAPSAEWTSFGDGGALGIIEQAARERRSGLLMFVSGSLQKSVQLDEGRIASCASSNPGESFGERLVRRGSITEAQRVKAVDLANATNVAIGRAAVLLGAMREDEVAAALREKIDHELGELERWTDGRWTLINRPSPRVKPVRLALALDELRQFARAEFVASRNGTRYHRETCTSMRRVKAEERTPIVDALAGAQRGLEPCRICVS